MTDRIDTVIYASGAAHAEIEAALADYSAYIAAQTLSLSLRLEELDSAPAGAAGVEWGKDTIRISITLTK